MSTSSTGHHHAVDPDQDPHAYWEDRYGQADAVWSGKANATTATLVQEIGLPGEGHRHGSRPLAVDLGCGEGGDVLWLAEQGWQALGLDISSTAVERGRRAAAERGLQDRASFHAQDLGLWDPERASLDLVTASFFQSPVPLERDRILRCAAQALVPGGHLVVVSHAAVPPWAPAEHQGTVFPTPQEELDAWDLGESCDVVLSEVRTRWGRGPQGQEGELQDAAIVLRRREEPRQG